MQRLSGLPEVSRIRVVEDDQPFGPQSLGDSPSVPPLPRRAVDVNLARARAQQRDHLVEEDWRMANSSHDVSA